MVSNPETCLQRMFIVAAIALVFSCFVALRTVEGTDRNRHVDTVQGHRRGFGSSSVLPQPGLAAPDHDAYALLLTHESRLKPLLALEEAFREVQSSKQRVVFITSSIANETRKILDLFNLQTILLPDISYYPKAFKPHIPRWYDSIYRFELLQHTQFSRLVSVDVDITLHGNIDDLFDKSTFSLEFMYAPGAGFLKVCGDVFLVVLQPVKCFLWSSLQTTGLAAPAKGPSTAEF